MKKKFLIVLFGVIAIVPSAYSKDIIRFGGSGTVGRGFVSQSEPVYERRSPGKDLQIVGDGTGSTTGIQKVLSGDYDIGGVTRELTPEEKNSGIYLTTVGYDAIVVFVHKDREITDISLDQLNKVFSGQIVNWKDLGDQDHTIQALAHPKVSGTNAIFEEVVLKKPLGSPVIFSNLGDPEEQYKVAKDPWAISFASESMARDPNIRVLKINGVRPSLETVANKKYPLSRAIFLATKGKPLGAIKNYIDFILSPDGQKIVGEKFLPLQ